MSDDVSQSCLNLRWLIRQRCEDPSSWAVELNKATRTYLGFSRAHGLLVGLSPNEDEVRLICEVFGVEAEEFLSVPLYSRETTLFQRNLNYLIETITHGQKDRIAKTIGVTPPQFSRWANGEIKPHKRNLRQLLKVHGIDPDLDLETVPLFLSMEPASGFALRSWVAQRVQDLPAAEIARIYPALKKILRYDD